MTSSLRPIPLRGVRSDSAYMASFLNQIDGPILSSPIHRRAVISNAGVNASNVVWPVYVAALIPEEGETPHRRAFEGQHHQSLLMNVNIQLGQMEDGTRVHTRSGSFRRGFAADVPKSARGSWPLPNVPLRAPAFADTSGPVAWKNAAILGIIATEDVGAGIDIAAQWPSGLVQRSLSSRAHTQS